MLEARNISKSYRKKQILRDVCFNAPPGAYTCIVGRNGSGKSTLLQILAGMLAPDCGGAVLLGDQMRSSAYARNIGYVAQADSLFGHLSARDNIAFYASAAGLSMSASGVAHFTQLLGIDPFLKQRVSTLSGGQRRRVAICVSLLHDPACLLLDEPFSGLDLVVKDELFRSLEELRRAGKIILYTTHNIDEIFTPAKLIALCGGTCMEVEYIQSQGDFRQFMLNLITEKGASI